MSESFEKESRRVSSLMSSESQLRSWDYPKRKRSSLDDSPSYPSVDKSGLQKRFYVICSLSTRSEQHKPKDSAMSFHLKARRMRMKSDLFKSLFATRFHQTLKLACFLSPFAYYLTGTCTRLKSKREANSDESQRNLCGVAVGNVCKHLR